IHFIAPFNQVIQPGSLPDSITIMDLDNTFDQPLDIGALPNSLRHLLIRGSYLYDLKPGVLPQSLTTLECRGAINVEIMEGSLPQSLETLVLCGFNRDITPGLLPKSLTYLMLSSFDHELHPGSLSSSLTSLTLGDSFNRVIQRGVLLPESLTELSFESTFNQTILPDSLPSSLNSLNLSSDFNQPLLPRALPHSLKSLLFAFSYNQEFKPNVLPSSLTELFLGESFDRPLPAHVLPSSLTMLTLQCERYEQELILPPSVHTLHTCQAIPSPSVPSALQRLQIYGDDRDLDPRILPQSIRHLLVEGCLLQPGPLPPSITLLNICSHEPITFDIGSLPASLTTLFVNRTTTEPFSVGCLPTRLTTLKIVGGCNQRMLPGYLPQSLTKLAIGSSQYNPFTDGSIPESLVDLTCRNWNLETGQVIRASSLQSLQSSVEYTSHLPVSIKDFHILELVDRYSFEKVIIGLPSDVRQLQKVTVRVKDEDTLFRLMVAIPNVQEIIMTMGFSQWRVRPIDPAKGLALIIVEEEFKGYGGYVLSFSIRNQVQQHHHHNPGVTRWAFIKRSN
ncbi:hypothetical protein SAMD00019534_035350, partial [Acytostelium subglobosum LB1]|uniref:hypothetical protein n=1 Tax=Acytostelium subglobosum LB1 TaxID=1410327 RepID=UPI000644D275